MEYLAMKTTEETSRSLANDLLNPVVSMARLMLRKYGNFGPFGYFMDEERNVRRATLEIPRLPADPNALMRLLTDHLRKKTSHGSIRGVATGVNVTLAKPSAEEYADALVVHIELQDGYAAEAILPYQIIGGQLKGLLPRRVVFGQIHVNNTVRTIYPET
jgi:hypothetical protein